MTKNILFIGPEQPLWQEFREHTRRPDSIWSAEFVHSQLNALSLVHRAAFDAVVADVQGSDTSGLDLLDEVQRLQPGSFRLILSDFADTESTLRCMGRGHHHLSKPCDVSTLLNALAQESTLRTWLPNGKARALLAQMRQIPSPPSIYFQILAELRSADASVDRVGTILSQDLAITAKLLQLANSAVFGLQLQVLQATEAVAYVGLETTKSLVLLAHSFATFDRVRLAGFSVERLWRHSVLAGRFAKRIAEEEDGRPEVCDQAFTAGLLHDVGKLLFAANLPKEYGQVLALAKQENCALHEAEAKVLGAAHAEVGGCLLGTWGLPRPIVEAVALHHVPNRLTTTEFTPLTATHAADVVSQEVTDEKSGTSEPGLDEDYLLKLGLSDRPARWRTLCQECLAGSHYRAASAPVSA